MAEPKPRRRQGRPAKSRKSRSKKSSKLNGEAGRPSPSELSDRLERVPERVSQAVYFDPADFAPLLPAIDHLLDDAKLLADCVVDDNIVGRAGHKLFFRVNEGIAELRRRLLKAGIFLKVEDSPLAQKVKKFYSDIGRPVPAVVQEVMARDGQAIIVSDGPWRCKDQATNLALDALVDVAQCLSFPDDETFDHAELIRRLSVAVGVLRKVCPPTTATRKPLLQIEGRNVFVNGKLVPLDMTAEATEDALAFLKELVREPGSWKSSSEIGKKAKIEGVRFDRILKHLPEAIQDKIESCTRKGYRLKPLA